MKSWIPNGITLGNLILGCWAILFIPENPIYSIYCVIGAAILDFFDGFVARLLNVSSALGGQLDSLADVVSFGVVPSLWAYHLLPHEGILQVLPFIIAAGAAYRLARFNLDPNNNSGHFKGLPVPSNAMIWMGVVGFSYSNYLEIPTALTIGLICITTFLMVSTTPLLSLKIKGFGWKNQEIIWILLFSSFVIIGVSLVFFESIYLGIIGVMAMYLILSLSYYKKISS